MRTTDDGQIDYEGLVDEAMREAMRGVIKSLLIDIAKTGLPGEHHFYISFNTNAPGVNLSKRIKEKYPDEMTIVLQHRFWNLAVHDEYFEVSLTFNSIPERLVIPFASITVFVDPSVRFGHQFTDPAQDHDASATDGAPGTLRTGVKTGPRALAAVPTGRIDKRRAAGPRKRVTDKVADNADTAEPGPVGADADTAAVPGKSLTAVPTVAVSHVAPADPARQGGGAKIVSLDQFRKK